MQTNIKEFDKACTVLNNIISSNDLTWEQKNAKVFKNPSEVLTSLVEYGFIRPESITPASDKGELLELQRLCKNKLTYLRNLSQK